ncbi:hypothetical protein XU06_29395 (plasmid) [Rhodococcus erythropolis]|nr:hypothetical protein XU06_29395 [Rhodococcus erythropolis]
MDTKVPRSTTGDAAGGATHADQLRQLPREVTPETAEAVWRLYAPEHFARKYQAPRINRDLSYGPHDRQRLDVHCSSEMPAGAPVLLFVPGGGFVAGDKHMEGTPYYDNVGGWAAANGMIGVTIDYRLAPTDPWPAGAIDIDGAVGWLRKNIAHYGGDANRIVLMSHSAGASHAAGYLAGHAGDGPSVAAAVLLSGIYALHEGKNEAVAEMYYGSDPATFGRRQPLPEMTQSSVPVLYGVAELDPESIHGQTAAALEAHRAFHHTNASFIQLQGHNHISEIVSLGVDDEQLAQALHLFIAKNT